MRFLKLFSLTLLFCCALLAQRVQWNVNLTWLDATNPPDTTYNVYRATCPCVAGEEVYTKLNPTPLAVKTYDDVGPAEGAYQYVVRSFRNTLESANSNVVAIDVGAPPIRPEPPTGVQGKKTAVANITVIINQ